MTLAYTAKTEKFKLEIIHDDDAGFSNPRDNDNAGTMLTWESQYSSPDGNDWSSFASFLQSWRPRLETVCPECGNDGSEAWKVRYYEQMNFTRDPNEIMASPLEDEVDGPDGGGYMNCTWCGHEWLPGPGEGEGGVCLMLSRGGYDGSIHTAGNLDEWSDGDREPEGVIFCDAATIAKEWGAFTSTPGFYQDLPMLEWVAKYLEGEVKEYSTWAVGNVYGYRLFQVQKVHVTVTLREGSKDTLRDDDEDRWEEVDACWGFITEDPDKDIVEWSNVGSYVEDEAELVALLADLHYV